MGAPLNVDPAKVRQFIFDHFNDDELVQLCFDHFPAVFRDFTSAQTKRSKVIQLISYCLDRESIPELMTILANERPEPYRRFFTQFNTEFDQKINLNTADLAELRKIPQIGSSLADRIIKGRPYESIDDLSRIGGIGTVRLQILRNYCVI